ncbi:hypothetical protein J7E81_15275 [Bacillus sp. ISL-18]|uniref:hypothetical protein n=1 Tax=Bacillus sp. ISL-18 TaxID=2819118 RepID=UPI001BEC886C|nr:hypothetical protein [Bacillus sp. ISL-18]MBT2656579.1 hypothetical protein [Bacillus sp. ISL-18]
MDINKLKEQADNQIQLREQLISRYEDFRNICDSLNDLIVEKQISKKEELIAEYKDYFTSNGFEVSEDNNFHKAIYKDTVIEFRDESPTIETEVHFSLAIRPQGVYQTLVIKPESSKERMLYFKNVLKYKDAFIEFKTGEEMFNSIKEVSELEKLTRQLEENINWYDRTVKEFKDINFIYGIYKTDREFTNFKQFFEAI